MNGKRKIDMSLYDKYSLKEQLQNGIITVVFEKADGSIRSLQCTLNSEFMPAQLLTEQQDAARIRNENADLLAVWDVENNGWRSFNVSKVKHVLGV